MIDESTRLLGGIPYEILKKWCEEYEKSPELLSEVVPVIGDRNENGIKINSIANHLVLMHGIMTEF
ncbi:hypothetical protein COD22_06425 [Bacillus thuringiensis]|nr:hypothetical protein COD22_06425 [Bacillus thuringiensis]